MAIGLLRNTVQLPWPAWSAWRRFSSNMLPTMKPMISGVLGIFRTLNRRPRRPKNRMHCTSNTRLLEEYPPTQHMTTMQGSRMCFGMSSSFTKIGRPALSKISMKIEEMMSAR